MAAIITFGIHEVVRDRYCPILSYRRFGRSRGPNKAIS
jgi:hypothetical protein